MNCAVIIKNKVDNIIGIESVNIPQVEQATGYKIIPVDKLLVIIGDEYNAKDGKFYRNGQSVETIPTPQENAMRAVDAYTEELLRNGVL